MTLIMDHIITILIIAIVVGAIGFVAFKSLRNRRSVTGHVAEKIHNPERTVTRTRGDSRPRNSVFDNDRNRRTRFDMTSETRTIPESWSVKVTPDDGSSAVIRKVPKDQWDALEVGDAWSD